MIGKRKLLFYIKSFLAVFVLCLIMNVTDVFANQADITTTDGNGDLTVMFTFDSEVVDIIFHSPSGAAKRNGDSDVQYASGDKWCTYRISNAEAGKWSVEYDLGTNTEIKYSVIKDNYGIWIQYFNIDSMAENKAKLSFEADFDSSDVTYEYEIYAVNTSDEIAINKVSNGRTKANEKKELDLDLSSVSSGNYVLRLDVYYKDGEAELFDSVTTEPFDFNNTAEPDEIADFSILADTGNLTCDVDWSEHTEWKYEGFRLTAYAGGEVIYEAELDKGTKSDSFLFPADETTLDIDLTYKSNGIWSAAKRKTVDFENEFLKIISKDVTNSGQIVIEYKTTKERTLTVNINDVEESYNIDGNDRLFFDINEGDNQVYARFDSDNMISFAVDSEIYYDINSPEIKLYDDIDGKTFDTDNVAIIGKISGGNILSIDGEDIEVGAEGEFKYFASLKPGENVFEIEAGDVNGNNTKMVLTLYRASAVISSSSAKDIKKEFMPLFISFIASVLIFILSLIFMKKRQKTEGGRKHRISLWVLWDILLGALCGLSLWKFAEHYLYSNSIRYLEMAERSASEAAQYLRMEQIYGIASAVTFILLVISILLTILFIKSNKKVQSPTP